MKHIVWLSVVFAAQILGAVLTYFFAPNVELLWYLWMLSAGLILGHVASGGKAGILYGISILIMSGIIVAVVVRSLPVHSLGWEKAYKIEIFQDREKWKIEITDSTILNSFKKYAERGRYETMEKSGHGYSYGLIVYVEKEPERYYFFLGDTITEDPYGTAVTVFVPKEYGFRDYFDVLLKKHGH